MSMLAEHKTKPSWVLNPRASDWSKDQNKLGQKMLEKMGWSVGKGLGAKEQGRTEALRIAYKADVRGLGAKRKQEQEFALQQQENFQKFLQELNGSDDRKVTVKSLEEKSKTSRARVHYHKFTRGKDISRYSEKDLSCIVGSGFVPVQPVADSSPKSGEEESEGFRRSSEGENSQTHCNGNASNQEEADMGLRSGRNPGHQAGEENDCETSNKVKKKKKRNVDEQDTLQSELVTDVNGDAALKKEKKKKKAKTGNEVEVQLAKEELEEENSKMMEKNKTDRSTRSRIAPGELEDVTEQTNRRSPRRKPEPELEVSKKKKKKVNEKDEDDQYQQNTGEGVKTKKLNKKELTGQSQIDLGATEMVTARTNNRSPKRKPEPEIEGTKKKKKVKRAEGNEDQQVHENTEEGNETKVLNKKERTGRSRIDQSEMETLRTNRRSPRRKQEPEVELTKKKKKANKAEGNEDEQNHENTEEGSETKVLNKKEPTGRSRTDQSEMETVTLRTNRRSPRRKPESDVDLQEVTKIKKKKVKSEQRKEEHHENTESKKTKKKDEHLGGDYDATFAVDDELTGPSPKKEGKKRKKPLADPVLNSEPEVSVSPSPRKKKRGPGQEFEEQCKRKQKKQRKKIGLEEKKDPVKTENSNLVGSTSAQGTGKIRTKLQDVSRQNSTESKESSSTQKDSEDNETEQGSTTSRASSSFLYELLGKRKSLAKEPVATEDYKKWHILNSSSSDELYSEDERLTGVFHREELNS